MVRVSSPPHSQSKAVVCVSTPRMYLQSGYFQVHMSYFVFQKDYNFDIRELFWMRAFLFTWHLSFIDGNCQPEDGHFHPPSKKFWTYVCAWCGRRIMRSHGDMFCIKQSSNWKFSSAHSVSFSVNSDIKEWGRWWWLKKKWTKSDPPRVSKKIMIHLIKLLEYLPTNMF